MYHICVQGLPSKTKLAKAGGVLKANGTPCVVEENGRFYSSPQGCDHTLLFPN